MTTLPIPCLVCGIPSVLGRCQAHRNPDKPSPSRRGYGRAWARLSRYVRAASPVCVDCGATEDLTADHLRWPARGPADVEVVCRPCNSRRGPRRVAPHPSWGPPTDTRPDLKSGTDSEAER